MPPEQKQKSEESRDSVLVAEDWQLETINALACEAKLTRQQTIHRRDQCATPMLLCEWREITQADAVVAEVWQRAAVEVVQNDSLVSTDETVVLMLARATRDAARAWLCEVAQAWLKGSWAEWIEGKTEQFPAEFVPDGEGGVPAVSLALARYIQKLDPDAAEAWTDAEDDRAQSQASQLGLWIEDQPFALPGWYVATDPPVWQGPGKPPEWVKMRAMSARHKATQAAIILAVAVWNYRVKSQILKRREREAATRTPALTTALSLPLMRLGQGVEFSPHDGSVLTQGKPTGFAVADLDTLRELERLSEKIHTLAAKRTYIWCAQAAWLAYTHEFEGGFKGDGWTALRRPSGIVEIEVSGGKAGLARIVHAPKKQEGVPYDTLSLFHRLSLRAATTSHEDRQSALVEGLDWTRQFDGHPGKIGIRLSWWWGVNATHRVEASSDRLLMPVLDVPPMPGMPPKCQNAIVAMEMAAIFELTERSRELALHGAVDLSWHKHARECGVTRGHMNMMLETWHDLDRWRQIGSDWRIGAHDAVSEGAHELLVAGGRLRLSARNGGRAVSEKRRIKANKSHTSQ